MNYKNGVGVCTMLTLLRSSGRGSATLNWASISLISKVQFQHQPRNYREVLQYIAIQVPSIGIYTLQKSYEVSVQGTESGGAPDQGVYDSNRLIFHGTCPEKNGLVIWSNLTCKISAELAMQLISISIALRTDTGVVPIEKN